MSAIVRMLWQNRAGGGGGFDQQLLQEEMLEDFPLNHFLDLLSAVTTAQIQASANDLEARWWVGVIHWEPDDETGKARTQFGDSQAAFIRIPVDIGPRQQQPLFLRLGFEVNRHPNSFPFRSLLDFSAKAAQRTLKRPQESGEGKVHQNNAGAYSRPG